MFNKQNMKVIVLNLFITSIYCSLTSDYYEDLIQKRIKEAETYKLPQNNEKFIKGIQLQNVIDLVSFDFIIVGAGSSGSVLATRLSEIDDFNILLLEAGSEEDDFSQIMAFSPSLQQSKRNWGYFTTSQTKSCLGMVNRKCHMPRGKSIGGSSSINVLSYVRGNPQDYDEWVKLGNPGWSYQDVLPYFKKSENSQIKGDPGYHGKGGFLNVEYSSPHSLLLHNFLEAYSELNVPSLDYNGLNQFGASRLQLSTKGGRRQSSGTTFLDNARHRRNLAVLTKVLVTKIIIDPYNKVARGVEFVTKDQKFKVEAKKEVIVSGGVFNSPQLLMLSGIGPKSHLKQLGIEVIADLPVGQNLVEHTMFSITFNTNYTTPTTTLTKFVNMYLQGLGPLTRGWNSDGVAFIHTKYETKKPMIEHLFFSPGGATDPTTIKNYNYNQTIFADLSKNNDPGSLSMGVILLHPKSRGRITLKSANPIDFPNIDINMFDKQEDIDVMLEGVEFVLKLMKTQAFKSINATVYNDFSICRQIPKNSKKYWQCLIQNLALPFAHSCGSTRMGPHPKISVVDHNLKVHGLKRLRVVDAGVFPATISGHLHAAAVMVAEKIADVIKGEYVGLTKEKT